MSAAGLKCASSAIGVLRLLTRANGREEKPRVSFSAIAPFSGTCAIYSLRQKAGFI